MSIQEFVARAAGCGAEANHLDAGPLWDRGRFQMVIHDDWMIWGTPNDLANPHPRHWKYTQFAWWTKATKELYAALLGSMTTHKNGKPINEMGQQMKFWFIQLHGEIMEKCWGGILVQSYIYIYIWANPRWEISLLQVSIRGVGMICCHMGIDLDVAREMHWIFSTIGSFLEGKTHRFPQLLIVFLWRAALFTADGAQPEKKQKSWWILRMSHWLSWKATPTMEEIHIVPLGYTEAKTDQSDQRCFFFTAWILKAFVAFHHVPSEHVEVSPTSVAWLKSHRIHVWYIW